MAQADFVKTRIGIESRRQTLRLIGFVRARTKVGIQPNGDQIIFAGNILNFENDGDTDAAPGILIRS